MSTNPTLQRYLHGSFVSVSVSGTGIAFCGVLHGLHAASAVAPCVHFSLVYPVGHGSFEHGLQVYSMFMAVVVFVVVVVVVVVVALLNGFDVFGCV